MKTKLNLVLAVLLNVTVGFAADPKPQTIEENIKKLNWNGIEVVFIEDSRFPTYDLTIYFADGALSDGPKTKGLSNYSFGFTDAGTSTLSQEQILDQMEFYGTEIGTDVTHEYSTVAVSGLAKDLNTSMSLVCSLLRDGTYPEKVIKKELGQTKAGLQSLVSSPQALAERVFREISLGGSDYAYPVAGKVSDFNTYNSKALKEKMNYFMDKVKKRIYLTGPKSILSVEKVFKENCRLAGTDKDFVRTAKADVKESRGQFVFVPVPDANQVQVKIGRFLNSSEVGDRNLDALASDFLGGGFTSKLMREVRVKRGLTYSIGSYISTQKQYGRSAISTFTKNETIDKLIEVIDQTLADIKKEGVKKDELSLALEGMVGAHPFKFENNRAFLAQLLYLDHIGKPYSDLFDFKDAVVKFGPAEVEKKLNDVFDMKKQVIFVLGDKKILPSLKKLEKKFGKLKVMDYRPFI
jgi:zinc protease